MKSFLKKISLFEFPGWTIPLALLAVCLLSYSLLIKYLGLYWDDWALTWISQKLGSEALASYFSTNRPIWGMIYQLTTPIVGYQPWHWHIFGVLWRWLAVLSLYWTLRQLWPKTRQPALWISLLWAVYPGSQEQFIPLIFGHFFVVLTAFFLSLGLNLKAMRDPKRFWLYTFLAMPLSLLNLLTLEYFFLLELIRPFLIWLLIREEQPDWRKTLKPTLLNWLPYLGVFLLAGFWRVFFFEFQTTNYQPKFLADLQVNPLAAVLSLLKTIGHDLWVSTFGAWAQVFQMPDPAELGRMTTMFFAALVIASIVALFIYLIKLKTLGKTDEKKNSWAWQAAVLGLLAMLISGWPYWMIDLPLSLGFPNSRLTLSFMTGVSFFLAGLLGLLPLPRWSKLAILSVALGFAIGLQFRNANVFRRDWVLQNKLFWQMSWRVPGMQESTAVLVNDLPIHFSTDNSLSGALNWVYSVEDQPDTMPYLLYYPSLRLGGGLPALEPDLDLYEDYLAIEFFGNTSDVISIYYDPPVCLRVLDPDLSPYNLMLPEQMREAARLSNYSRIITDQPGVIPQEDIFGSEPTKGWCYYYAKADLAAQQEDWDEVVRLAEEAFTLGDHPNDPVERVPFIEGYAHIGDWQRAYELNQQSALVSPLVRPLLCKLWERIDAQTLASPQKDTILEQVQSEMDCLQ